MKVRWSELADADVDEIGDFINRENPWAAERVVIQIEKAGESLLRFPNRGRPGRLAGTRELLVPKLPYFLVYRVSEIGVEILRAVHHARQWPPPEDD